jgi:hypothetical protein
MGVFYTSKVQRQWASFVHLKSRGLIQNGRLLYISSPEA